MRSPRPSLTHHLPFLLSVLLLALPACAQNFLQPKVVYTSWPLAVYTADMNGDGIPDLICIDRGATATFSDTHVLLGDGKGNFTQSAMLVTAGTSIAIGDLTGTGHNDIGWLTWQQTNSVGGAIGGLVTLTVAPNRGDGTFSTQTTTTFPTTVRSPSVFSYLTVAPFHHKAPLDVIAQDSANNLIYSFQPAPGKTSSADYSFANIPDGVGPATILDLNGDGHFDLVVNSQAKASAQIFILDPNPTTVGFGGVVQPTSTAHGNSGIYSLLLKDVNNDGRPDLLAEGPNGRIDVFAGNGDGTFATTSSGGSGSLNGLTGNGGHLIAYANRKQDNLPYAITSTPAGISSLLGSGTAYLGLNGIYNAGPGHSSYALADFNNDGNLDIAVDSPEGVAILFGNSDATFQSSPAYAAGAPAMSGALADFNNDGILDAVVSTSDTQAQLLLGSASGVFTAASSPTTISTPTPGLWSIIAARDFNGDGIPDIALTADGSNAALPQAGQPGMGISIQLGNGDGTFKAPFNPKVVQQFTFPAPSSCSPPFARDPGLLYGSSAFGDFNSDGFADIANRDISGYRIIRGNNGSGTSSNSLAPTLFFSGVDGSGMTVDCDAHAHDLVISGDLNNDGIPDLVYQGSGANSGSLMVYLTNSAGVPVLAGDLSIDGSLTSPGQYNAPPISPAFGGPPISNAYGGLGVPIFPGSAIIADLDNDGNKDIIVLYHNLAADITAPNVIAHNTIYIWYGTGNGKFLSLGKHGINPVRFQPQRNYYQVAVADLNLDGIPDLILSDGYVLSVQLGNGDGTFGAETHYLAGQGINSISVADIDHDGKPDLILANGGAILTNPVANRETLATNNDVNTGGITVLLNHATPALAQASATLAASPEPTTYSNAFSLIATFATATTQPTGTVSFSIDGNPLGSANIMGTTAAVAVPSSVYATLAVGAHTLTGVYSGDLNYAPSTLTGSHTVTQLATSTSLILCVDPPGSNFPCGNPISATPLISPITMYFGQSVDGVAIESSTNLTGTITFYSGSSIFCVLNANLSQGALMCPTASGYFPAGTSTVTAVYSGDSNDAPSTSNGIVVNVLPDPTTATVQSSLNPSVFGQAVTFTASVQGNYSVGIGTVLFLDGSTTLGSATLDATGTATFTTSTLAIGTHPIRVAFPGSASFNSAVSGTLNQVVLSNVPLLPVTLDLNSGVNPSYFSQSVTFTVHASVNVGAVPPAGTITFYDAGVALATIPLTVPTSGVAGVSVATFTTSTLAVGTHPITASYSGSTTISPGTTITVNQVVTAEATTFSLNVTPVPVSLEIGHTAILLASVTETAGFSAPVQLTCSGLPAEATCTFIQSLIPAGGGSTSLYVYVQAPHPCGSDIPYSASLTGAQKTAATLLACLIFLPLTRRRTLRARAILFSVVAFLGLSTLSGCGHCTDLGVRPGNYTFTVAGTAQGVSATQSQLIHVTVRDTP